MNFDKPTTFALEPWTKDEEERLRALWNDAGLSASECGRQLARSRAAVVGKARRMNLAERSRTFHSKPRAEKPAKPRVERRAAPKLEPVKKLPADTRHLHSSAWDALPDSTPVSLVDLEHSQCKWPIGDERPQLFCALPSGDSVYCEHHTRVAVGKGTESERKATAIAPSPLRRAA